MKKNRNVLIQIWNNKSTIPSNGVRAGHRENIKILKQFGNPAPSMDIRSKKRVIFYISVFLLSKLFIIVF